MSGYDALGMIDG